MEHKCHGHAAVSSVCQTLDEMDFERGLWYAAMTGDEARVRQLLDKGHSPNEEDKSGYTALHYAARCGNSSICSRLIEFGARVNATTRAGMATPLQRAALAGKLDTVKLLVKHGADIGVKDEDGRTALHRAVEGGSESVIIYLLETAPHLALFKDKGGRTPAQCASHRPHLSALFPSLPFICSE